MGIANGYFDSNFADWQTAGDVCDTDITPFSGASAIDLMDMNGVVDTKQKCIDILKMMCLSSHFWSNLYQYDTSLNQILGILMMTI